MLSCTVKYAIHPFLRHPAILHRFAPPTPHLSSRHESAVTPLECALAQVLILKNFKSSRMNTYKNFRWGWSLPRRFVFGGSCPYQIGRAFTIRIGSKVLRRRRGLPV